MVENENINALISELFPLTYPTTISQTETIVQALMFKVDNIPGTLHSVDQFEYIYTSWRGHFETMIYGAEPQCLMVAFEHSKIHHSKWSSNPLHPLVKKMDEDRGPGDTELPATCASLSYIFFLL